MRYVRRQVRDRKQLAATRALSGSGVWPGRDAKVSDRLASQAAVEFVLDEVRRNHHARAEAFLRDTRGVTVNTQDGVVRFTEIELERGVGLRVLDDNRMGFAHTSDLSTSGLTECVALALASARVTSPDVAADFSRAVIPPDGTLGIHDPTYGAHDVQEKTRIAQAVEVAVRAADGRIMSLDRTSYRDIEGTTIFATSDGAFGSFRATFFAAGTSCIAQQGDEKQLGSFSDGGRTFATLDPAKIGAEAARRAVEKLGARHFETQRIDIVFGPYQAIGLLGGISALFSADAVLKGRSLFAGRLGHRVASEAVTLVDESRRVGGTGTGPFDGEGTLTRDLVLIKRGELCAYLHSIRTANAMHVVPTGNARRSGYAGTPHPGISNLVVQPGSARVADVVASSDRALRITSLLNLHTINPVSGEFSLTATAIYLVRGVAQYPVHGITIAGNLTELLTAIDAVGDDLRVGASSIGSPTLLVRDVSVAGG